MLIARLITKRKNSCMDNPPPDVNPVYCNALISEYGVLGKFPHKWVEGGQNI
jgi:hypothetical protein